MIEQGEKSRERLRRKFTGPNPAKTDLAHNHVLDRKLKDVGVGEKVGDNKLASVLMRTFCIGFPDPDGNIKAFGTAFALDVYDKQYLVTASHVVESIDGGGIIHILQDKKWRPFEVAVVGKGDADNPETDIAVLAAKVCFPVPLALPFNPSVVNMFWGQQVYFCGFPYGFYTDVDIAEGHPVAMTKGAVLSGMHTKSGTPTERERGLFVLDGHNNIGFSGGPAVFQLGESRDADFQVFGVVVGYRSAKVDVKHEGTVTGLTSQENTGLVLCPSIVRAIDMIESNPIGFDLHTFF